ncbi:MAG: FmdE family protein [Desulfosarcinaceae bacterium]
MKKLAGIIVISCALVAMLLCGPAPGADFGQTVSAAVKSLDAAKGDPDLLVLTDAPYVRVAGLPALPYLAAAEEATGCSVGKGNLLFFQRSQDHSLRMLIFKKTSGDGVILSLKDRAPVVEKLKMNAEAISQKSFWDKAKSLEAGRDMFTLAAIANVWAKGGPYDFLKSAELHNHICPGLTSGYLMARYILNTYPLKKGQRYTVLACPVWCKEDAFQVVLDCTPGKKGLIVKQLSDAQKEKVSVRNPAGLLLIWDAENKAGRGIALSFDFERLRAFSPKNAPKAAMVLAALGHLDKPEQFVSSAAEFDLTEKLYQEITRAGSNPYEVVGLVKK